MLANVQRSEPHWNVAALECKIRCGSATCPLGGTPKINVALINRTRRPMVLVGSLDGSSERMRFPHCSFEVIGPDGKSATAQFTRCGFMNTLRVADFFTVQPGMSFDPHQNIDDYGFFSASQLSPDTFSVPGEYRIRYVYSTKSSSLKDWSGNDSVAGDAKIVGMFAQVPKLDVRSNELKILVIAPGK